MSKSSQPDYLTFLCPLTVDAADDAARQMPRFRMVAYTGGVMRIAGFPHPVVVDLEGLAIDRQDIPVRLDHNPRQGVGHTSRVAVENGHVIAEGLVSRDTSWARDVAKSGVNGFPWQASIGAAVVDAAFIPNGQSVTVNGRTFAGPLHVVRKAVLKEISFVDSGADPNTSASLAAHSKEPIQMEGTDTTPATPETTVAETAAPEPTPAPAPETPAARPTPTTVQAIASDDPVTQMRQRLANETRRIEAIQKVCAGKHPAIEAQAIEDGWDETRTELQVLRASRPKAPAAHSPQRPSAPQVFEAAGLMASGLPAGRLEAMFQLTGCKSPSCSNSGPLKPAAGLLYIPYPQRPLRLRLSAVPPARVIRPPAKPAAAGSLSSRTLEIA